jgi:hypothetical protein
MHRPIPIRKTIIDRLWDGADPFLGFPTNLFGFDLQGWNSEHPYLYDTILSLRPSVIVEIGVWKGASTVFMAKTLQRLGLDCIIIAVDTWLGSWEHWVEEYSPKIPTIHGYPALYYQFMSNILQSGVAEYVLPLPTDSINAAKILKILDIMPNLIHLDAGHEYEAVLTDLRIWYSLLSPKGILIGDDYVLDGGWESVRRAFDVFFNDLGLGPIENRGGKCLIRKPA